MSSINNDIKDFQSLINYLDKHYYLSGYILQSILDFKRDTYQLAMDIVHVQDLYLKNKCNNYSLDEIISNKFEEKHLNIDPERNEDLIMKSLYQHKEEEEKEIMKDTNIDMDVEIKMKTKLIDIKANENNKLIYEHRLDSENIQNRSNNNDNIFNEVIPSTLEGGIHQVNNNNKDNLEETLSTENMDHSISTISTDLNSDENTRILIIRDFIENKIDPNMILDLHNISFILKKLSLNFNNANYFTIINLIFEFYKFVIFQSEITINQQQIEFLFTILVENSSDPDEKNIFYNIFADIIRNQQVGGKIFINEENLNFLFFDVLLNPKIELSNLSVSGFNLFKQLFFILNFNHHNVIVQNQKIVDIKSFDNLIGFQSLWQIYLVSKNQLTNDESQNLIVNLISIITKKEDNIESLYVIFNKIFDNLKENYISIKKNSGKINIMTDQLLINNNQNEDFNQQTVKLINLLFIVNNTRQKLDRPKESEVISVQFLNNFLGDSVKVASQLPSDTTIKDLRKHVSTKFLNNADENNISFVYKGNHLENDKVTLKDIKYENNGTILIYKGKVNLFSYEPDEMQLFEMISTIKSIFENCDNEVCKRGLKKNNFNVEHTINFFMEEINLQNIQREIEDEGVIMGNLENEKAVLHKEIFTNDRLDLLLDLLNLYDVDINKHIWLLLSAIKYSTETKIAELVDINIINFSSVFDISKPNKLLLNLRLLNNLIFGDKFFINMTTSTLDVSNRFKDYNF